MYTGDALTKPRSSICSWMRWVHNHFILVLVLSSSTRAVLGGQIVKHLPGFHGDLPFKLETGYISVDESELFYYFIESEGNPKEDPLFLWLSGGPGCSSFSGLINEVGPMEYDIDNYIEGFPKLRYYPYARTKTASMVFLDAPVGTGFSYARTPGGWLTSDTKSAEQSYQFLRKWLVQHPQFLSVQLFIGGDSYTGITVPLITKRIIDGNQEKAKPYMNIKGYLVGAPRTDAIIDENSKVDFAHQMAIISDEIYEKAKLGCNENYGNIDPANIACVTALDAVKKVRGIKVLLNSGTLNHREGPDYRSLKEGVSEEFLLSPSMIPQPWCTTLRLTNNTIWANDDSVQEALHVRKGTVQHWERCNYSLSYTVDVFSVVPVHKELNRLALKVLVESGDHDMAVPYVGTLKWIKSLNLTLVDDWRPWFVDDQVAGYTMKYSNELGYHLTFATVKGAGHPAPEFHRRECYYLFDRWVNNYPI